MTQTHKGYLVFLGALGMLFTLLSVEVSELMTWGEVVTPKFVAALMAHVGTVVAAFLGGRLIPTGEK